METFSLKVVNTVKCTTSKSSVDLRSGAPSDPHLANHGIRTKQSEDMISLGSGHPTMLWKCQKYKSATNVIRFKSCHVSQLTMHAPHCFLPKSVSLPFVPSRVFFLFKTECLHILEFELSSYSSKTLLLALISCSGRSCSKSSKSLRSLLGVVA